MHSFSSPQHPPSGASPAPSRAYRILLIDDNSFFSATFASLLQRSGYQVDVAADCREARRQYERAAADLIIMSIGIGEGDVAASLETLSTTFASTRLIAFVCESDRRAPQYLRVMSALKNRRVFHKPFRTEEVLAAIYAELVPRNGQAQSTESTPMSSPRS